MTIDVWLICQQCSHSLRFIEYGPHFRSVTFVSSYFDFCDHLRIARQREIMHIINATFSDPEVRLAYNPDEQFVAVLFF